MIPGVILFTLWFVAVPVVVIENPGVFPALRRSRLLVQGNGLRVFAVILILVVLVAAIGNLIDRARRLGGHRRCDRRLGGRRRADRAAVGARGSRPVLRTAGPRGGAGAVDLRVGAVASAELLRPGLLEGVSIMLAHAGAEPPAPAAAPGVSPLQEGVRRERPRAVRDA